MDEVKISVESKGEIERSISIEIPRSMYNDKFNSAVRKAAQQARVKGFRPGRAPSAVIKKLYGTQIHQDVLGELVSSAYHNAVEQHELKVVGYPDIAIDGEGEDEGNFLITAGVSVFPEPQIEEYHGLSFEVEVEPYSDELLNSQLTRLQEAYSESRPVEGRETAELGDTVQIDYRGTIEGAEFPGSSAEDTHAELGSTTLPKALEAGIVGQKVGEEREISVELTEEDDAERAGQKAFYVVKLKGLFRKELAEINDELAVKANLGSTAEELRTKLQELIQNDLERRNKQAREEQFFKALLEKYDFAVPQAMCDEEIRNFLYEMGLLDPSSKESQQFDVTAFRETLGEAARFRVRQAVALNAILEKEKVEASEEDVQAWLDARAAQEGRSRDDIDTVYGMPQNLSRLQRMVARERLLEDLIAKSNIVEVEKSPETDESK